jgi:signal transduction histidine kinase/ActR/RegA family two-component response regulator
MTVDTKKLRSKAFAEVGLLIKTHADAILQLWSQRAKQEQPHAHRVHHQTLQDHFRRLLDAFAKSLIEGGDGEVAHHFQPALEHGEQRWDCGWSLAEVIRDYQILRLVLVDYLEEAMHRSLHSEEHQAIGLTLDEAIAASVIAYVDISAEQIGAAEKEKADRAQETAETLRRHAVQLQEAHRKKDEFLAVMSHELRNPLAPLRNALHVLSLDQDEDTVHWARQLMERQVKVLSRLVDDLLNVSRIRLGKISLQHERMDLVRLVRETVEDYRGGFEEAGLELRLETPEGQVWVLGEPIRLAQAVGNLLHNAQKFTDRGGQVDVTVTALESTEVTIAVSDTGVGIAPEMITHIFEPYIQDDHDTERRRGGLGLGLPLVKGLVELHGGRVEAQSAGMGRGARFQITLPVAAVTDAEIETVKPAADAPRRMHVLVVEDNIDSADSTRAVLELAGHQVTVAHTGAEALAAARQDGLDVVLCDLGLPDMSGYEVAKALRHNPRTAAAHLIALSGHGSNPDRRRCQEAGFLRHYVKPVEPAVLQSLIAALGGAASR